MSVGLRRRSRDAPRGFQEVSDVQEGCMEIPWGPGELKRFQVRFMGLQGGLRAFHSVHGNSRSVRVFEEYQGHSWGFREILFGFRESRILLKPPEMRFQNVPEAIQSILWTFQKVPGVF